MKNGYAMVRRLKLTPFELRVTGLESAIENDRLIDMRRHRNANQYLDSFDRCKSEIKKLLPQIEHEQRTEEIFASLMNEARVYESLGKTSLIFLFVYRVYRYNRRMVY